MIDGVRILGPVHGLDQAVILGPCILGHPLTSPSDEPLVLGTGVVIRAFAVLYQGTTIGARSQIGHGALVRENNVIGEECSIGSGAHLEPGNQVDRRSRIHSGCFLEAVKMGEAVFCGPRVVFTDDPHPPCPRYLDCLGGVTVGDHVAIGAGAVLLPGVEVGERSLVAAGAVVTRSVESGSVVAGNPARVIGQRDELTCFPGFFERPYSWELAPTEPPSRPQSGRHLRLGYGGQ